MTLAEGIIKAGALLDEMGENMDQDIEEKLPHFFDMAQKEAARKEKIVRVATLTPESGMITLPGDFDGLLRMWADGKLKKPKWKGNQIVFGEPVEIEYFAVPETIGEDTPETYEFEVSEYACQILPFFAAGMCLVTDAVLSPNTLIQLWQVGLAELTESPGAKQSKVQNTFWR